MPKIHRCPECGRSHTAFSNRCSDCLAEFRLVPVELPRLGPNLPIGPVTNSETKSNRGGKRPGAGRPRIHKDNAERQKAWRDDHKG